MPQRADFFDLGRLALSQGEGRRLDVHVGVDPFTFGEETYGTAEGGLLPVRVDISGLSGSGYALRLRFHSDLAGPCMRCLEPARPSVDVDAREVDRPGEGEELSSPYVSGDQLDLHGWVRDSLALALPAQVVCREDCAGLCPECGADLNVAGPDHGHERPPDPRWAKLRELEL